MRKTKENGGITLVALVVTIVVLLILAGVSINLVLGNNGIITKAKDAETKSGEARENDLKGMNSIIDEMESALNGGGSDIKVPAEPTEETAPYFPDNTFTKKEGTIDTGLVIQDASGNEYVWVVVPRTKAVYKTTELGKTTFIDADYTSIEKDLKDYTSTYVTESGYSDTWRSDYKNVGWLTSDEYTELKNKMLKSVYANGGFYVGRYEAGIDTTTGTNRTSEGPTNADGKYTIDGMPIPLSKADAYPYTYVTRTQAQNLAKKVNSGNKTSSLMFGVQWDLVLAFMSKDTKKINQDTLEELISDSKSIGNYYNSAFQLSQTGKYAVYSNHLLSSTWNPSTTATASFVDSSKNKLAQSTYENAILVTTGTSEKNKIMNIYDMAGNVCEWDLESSLSAYGACNTRGGAYNNSGSSFKASGRGYISETISYDSIGFRVSLF